jgi:hypothetical protein
MPVCPTCNARIPSKLALKTTDVLFFPLEGAEQCPACHAKLVPTSKSIVACVFAFLALGAACLVSIRMLPVGGFVPGFLAGLASGLLISFGGLWVSARLLRFRTAVDGRYAYDRRSGLGLSDGEPRQ